MHTIQRERTRNLLKGHGIDCALFAHPNSVTWLTGFAMPVQTGPNFFAGAGPMVWYEDGMFTLVVLDAWAEATGPFANEPDGAVVSYLGYTIQQPIDGLGTMLQAMQLLWRNARGSIGIERADVTAAVYEALREAAPTAMLTGMDGWLRPLRMVKTPEEITKLRENFHLSDIGQRAASAAVYAGQREIDVWEAAHGAIQRATGCRVPMGNDCVVGYRQANIGGWPLDYPLRGNDSLIVDLSTIRYGYWSDSCNTFYAGDPTPKQQEMRAVIAETLALGASLLHPGAVAKDIDRAMRQFITTAGYSEFPHHGGHGVGVSGHEAPRIVPYSDETLAENMVILLEPGTYLPGETGVRLENAYLITADGTEQLTTHLD